MGTSRLFLFATTAAFTGLMSAPTIAQSPDSALAQFLDSTSTERRIPIKTIPTTISRSGSYFLPRNLQGVSGSDGITVTASDVTLDLNGYTLEGVAGSKRGIDAASSVERIVILNGMVRDWDEEGIYLQVAKTARLENLTVAKNGIPFGEPGLSVAQDSTVHRVVATENGGDGIVVGGNSPNTNCRAVITDSVASSNGGMGIRAFRALAMTVENCAAWSNGSIGIKASEGAVRGCTARSNLGRGFELVQCTASDSVAGNNGDDGFSLFASDVDNCKSHDNAGDGFDLVRVNKLRNSTASGNAGDGIRCTNERNLVDGNLLVLNQGWGVFSTDIRNSVTRNRAVDNSLGSYSVAGSNFGPEQAAGTATSPWANF
ncbi:MAG: right-handed parallel beta-helix repeat-containing protein [Planctomycetota bacterium]